MTLKNKILKELRSVKRWVTKTRRRKILISLLALLVLVTGIRFIFFAPGDIEAAWSPAHNAWARRKRLTVTNDSTDSLASGTAIAVSIDTKTLYQLGKLQEDCDDIRIVYQPDSSTYTNLDRYLSVSGEGNCSSNGATKVYFQLQAALASAASSSDYYIYYNNDQAAAPANSDNAFDIGSKDALLVCPFDGSTTCAAAETPSTETGAIRYSGAKTALSFDAHNDCMNDSNMTLAGLEQFAIEYWMKSDALNSKNDGRIFTLGSTWLDSNSPQNRYQFNVQIGGTWYYFSSGNNSRPSGSDWHHYAVTYDGDALRWFIDGVNTATNTGPSGSVNTGSLGLYMPGSTSCSALYRADLDEFRISEVARYTSAFTPQTAPFIRDDYTYALYHFDESGDDPRDTGKTFDDSGNGYDLNITGAKYIAGHVGVDNSSTDEGKTSRQSFASHEGIFIEEATTNKITNPSFEHGTFDTSWTADSNLWDVENTATDHYQFGSKSARLMTAVEYYSDSNADTDQPLYTTTSNKRLSQGFQVSSGESLSRASLYLYQVWGGARYLQVEIQTDSSGVPSGTPVSNGTSACSISYYGIPGAADFFDFTFATAPSLSASTQYHIVLKKYTNSGCTTEETSASSFNHVDWLYDGSSSTYSNGDRATMNESNVWTTQTGEDHTFVISDDTDVNYTASINPGNTNTHTLSAYAYNGVHDSYGELGVDIDSTIAQLYFGASAQTTTYTNMGSGWWKLSYTGTPPGGSSTYGVQVKAGKTIYLDGVQLEENSYPTTYTDGSLGSGYSWSDTENNSTSTRSAADLKYATSGNISKTEGSVSTWVKFPTSSANLPSSTFYLIFDSIDAENGRGYRLRYSKYTNTFGFQKYIDWTSYTISVSDTFSANEWVHLTATWDTTTGTTIYVNAGTPATNSNTSEPANLGSDLIMGESVSPAAAEEHSHVAISDFRVWDTALTSAEVTDLYQAGLLAHSKQYEVDRFSGTKGQDPIAVWHFDESYGSTANDSSKYGNSLTLYNSPSWNTDSVGARARLLRNLEFDGTDDIASRSADLDFNFGTESFSISGWFRHPSSVTGTDTILARYEDAGYKVYMNSSGYICAAIDDDSTWTPDDETCSTSAQGSYADSKWHHFEMVKDENTSLTLYIDAQRVNYDDTIEASGSLNSNSGIFIGADSNNSNYWTGFIDEIVIYPYARTADQVKADVFGSQTSALFGVDPKDYLTDGLMGYWKMDESSTGASQTDRSDSSGNGNTLTDNNTTASDVGKFGNSSDFISANSEYLSITNNASLSSGDVDYMITAWVKTPDITDAGVFINKVGNASNSEWEYFLRIHNDAGTRKFQFEWYTDNLGNNSNVHADTFGVPSNDTWYFVAAYHDATNDEIGISINGGPFDTAVANGGNDGDSSFQMARPHYDGDYWDGELDEVRIYKRVLPPAEVAALYNWAPGPVGYWNFDEGSGTTSTYDSSGNEHTGSLTGVAEDEWVPGKFGSALDLDGDNDYVDVTSHIDFQTQRPTVEAWIKSDDATSFHQVVNYGVGGANRGWTLITNGTSIQFTVRDGSSAYTAQSAFGTVNQGEWHHLAGIYDGSDVKVYVDGIVGTTTTSFTGSIDYTSPPTLSMGVNDSAGNDFDGKVDDVRVYNYARTQGQIIEDMNAGHPVPGSPIGSASLHLKFDEGYGDTANDSSPQDNDGNLAGGTSCPQSGDSACPVWVNSGKYNKALEFDISATTDDYVDTGMDSDFDFTTNMSLSAWINKTSTFIPAFGAIISKYGASNQASYYTYVNNSEGVCIRADDDGSTPFDVEACTADSYINNDEWTHVLVTYDGSFIRMYINGQEAGSGDFPYAWTGTLFNSTATLQIGATGAGVDYFDGKIDEVKIYNFALTADQVKVDMNQGAAQVMGASGTDSSGNTSWSSERSYCPPGDTTASCAPVGYWKLDENTDTAAQDSSGNANTGTLTNGPIWVPGKYGSAAFFDGADVGGDQNDYINAGTDSSVDNIFDGGGTATFWVNARTDGEERGRFVSKITSGGWRIFGDQDSPDIHVRFGVDFSITPGRWDTPNNSLPTNEWAHVAVVYNSDSATNDPTVYINGIAHTTSNGLLNEATTPSGTRDDDDTSSLNFGSTAGLCTIDGALDEIRLYNYARTPAQIAWDYNHGKPVGHWKLDECSGTVANDASGNGNNGTIDAGSTGNTSVGTCSSGNSNEMWNDGTTGKRNASLGFDNDDDIINMTDKDIFSFGDGSNDNPFSVSAWLNHTENTAGEIVTKSSAELLAEHRLALGGSGKDLYFNLNATIGYIRVTAADAVSTSTWHHVVATYDGSSTIDGMNLYLDGEKLNVTGSSGGSYTAMSNGDSPLTIGGRYNVASVINPISGLIDEVKIFNYELTPQQIRNDYNQGAVHFGPNEGSP